MKMMKFFDPVMFGVESFYSVIILLLCLMVFFKTKEMYDLTKHKGIQFFRYAFLFFGLSYASRLFLHFMVLGQNIVRHGRTIMPLSNLLVAFFSTLAIVYLLYSTIWKKVKGEQYITLANVLALIIAVVAFVSRSPAIIFFIQLCLLIIATVISAISHKRLKKKTNTKALYL